MLRYDDLNSISDGKLYGPNDLVKAGTHGCQGCSKCCESDMGKSIELTPYDIFQMCKGSGKSFDNLLTSFLVEISMIDGIALPNMKMDKGCGFLENGRCTIHAYRPLICRLFPLGRVYNDKGFDYFLQVHECPVSDKEDVVAADWLGLEDIEANTAFTNKWHKFLAFERKKVAEIREYAEHECNRLKTISEDDVRTYASIVGDEIEGSVSEYVEAKCEYFKEEAEDRIKEIMKTVLGTFYMEEYNREDFYPQFDERMKKCLGKIRKI